VKLLKWKGDLRQQQIIDVIICAAPDDIVSKSNITSCAAQQGRALSNITTKDVSSSNAAVPESDRQTLRAAAKRSSSTQFEFFTPENRRRVYGSSPVTSANAITVKPSVRKLSY
ncbi:hypothetical protein NPIL_650431, partial [Nephila pilipes]